MSKVKHKFDFKDITIVPETLSSINSRSEIDTRDRDGKLPIMVSPMDTVIDSNNQNVFVENDLKVCLPRNLSSTDPSSFISMSIDEFESYIDVCFSNMTLPEPNNILIDIANGHMKKLYDLAERYIRIRPNKSYKLMVGNIANPKTFEKFCEIGVDYVRVGIGGGSGCLTSANTGVHYPMASLINECYDLKIKHNYKTKIVADGGFRNYDDIIKAIMLGADYVMLGGLLNQSLESCSKIKLFKKIPISFNTALFMWEFFPSTRKYMYKYFRGMSTKEVQKKWGRSVLKTSEGISKYNKVEFRLESWVENFEDYLKSAMSYTNSRDLDQFRNSDYVHITENALKRFHK
jgi:IMP dehydrogenase/GMP reductase